MENEEKKQVENTEEELAAYEKLRQRVSKSFGELNEKISKESISQAMDKAMGDLREMGEHSKETITKAGETLKKDIASTAENIKPKVDKVTGPAKEQFDHWLNKGGALWHDIANEAGYIKELSRDKSGAFFFNITSALSEWSKGVTEKLGTSLRYKTGEMTHGGEFVCTSCEGKIHLKKPGRIPPCPKCSSSEFRRS
jgi:isocitrate dehydrogenase